MRTLTTVGAVTSAVLVSLVAAGIRPAGADDSAAPSPSPIGSESVEGAGPRGVDVAYAAYWADFQGRLLGVGEWAIGVRPTSRVGVWYTRQTVVAKGRDRANRFDTGIDRFGARWQAIGTERAGVEARYDGFRSARGVAQLSDGSQAIYAGPEVDCFTGSYATPVRPSDPDSPVARLSFGVNSVRGFDKSVFGLRLGAAITGKLARRLTADAGLDGYLEYLSQVAGEASPAFRTRLSAGLTYRPAAWAALRIGAELAPSGMPFAGSALSGLTSYMIYDPAGGISGLRSQSFGVACLGVSLTGTF